MPAHITAVDDVYDALINDRIYMEAWSEEKVFPYLLENKGKMYLSVTMMR